MFNHATLHRSTHFSIVMVMIVGLLLAGCVSPDFVEGLRKNPPIRAEGHSTEKQENPVLMPGSRLLVHGEDGNIYLIDPDGKNPLALTDDASQTLRYAQPTWSPLGDTIAWTRLELRGETVRGALLTSQPDGSNLVKLEVAYPPFYIYWSPSGKQLAYLSNWVSVGSPTMALRLVTLGTRDHQDTTLAKGAPFYFSWAPDGTRLLSHVSNERLEIQSLDGAAAEGVIALPGLFPAPQWLNDGERLLYAVINLDGRSQRLVTADLTGRELSEITSFHGRISFDVSATGEKVAYVLTPPGSSMNALGPLYLSDTAGGGQRQLSAGLVMAFFWSPDGQKLAYIEVEESESELGLRWKMWDGQKTSDYDFFVPSSTFLNNYLAFFDQYARSLTIWSPDSLAFAYAGVNREREAGIWIQRIAEELPQKVDDGVFATWSPTAIE